MRTVIVTGGGTGIGASEITDRRSRGYGADLLIESHGVGKAHWRGQIARCPCDLSCEATPVRAIQRPGVMP